MAYNPRFEFIAPGAAQMVRANPIPYAQLFAKKKWKQEQKDQLSKFSAEIDDDINVKALNPADAKKLKERNDFYKSERQRILDTPNRKMSTADKYNAMRGIGSQAKNDPTYQQIRDFTAGSEKNLATLVANQDLYDDDVYSQALEAHRLSTAQGTAPLQPEDVSDADWMDLEDSFSGNIFKTVTATGTPEMAVDAQTYMAKMAAEKMPLTWKKADGTETNLVVENGHYYKKGTQTQLTPDELLKVGKSFISKSPQYQEFFKQKSAGRELQLRKDFKRKNLNATEAQVNAYIDAEKAKPGHDGMAFNVENYMDERIGSAAATLRQNETTNSFLSIPKVSSTGTGADDDPIDTEDYGVVLDPFTHSLKMDQTQAITSVDDFESKWLATQTVKNDLQKDYNAIITGTSLKTTGEATTIVRTYDNAVAEQSRLNNKRKMFQDQMLRHGSDGQRSVVNTWNNLNKNGIIGEGDIINSLGSKAYTFQFPGSKDKEQSLTTFLKGKDIQVLYDAAERRRTGAPPEINDDVMLEAYADGMVQRMGGEEGAYGMSADDVLYGLKAIDDFQEDDFFDSNKSNALNSVMALQRKLADKSITKEEYEIEKDALLNGNGFTQYGGDGITDDVNEFLKVTGLDNIGVRTGKPFSKIGKYSKTPTPSSDLGTNPQDVSQMDWDYMRRVAETSDNPALAMSIMEAMQGIDKNADKADIIYKGSIQEMHKDNLDLFEDYIQNNKEEEKASTSMFIELENLEDRSAAKENAIPGYVTAKGRLKKATESLNVTKKNWFLEVDGFDMDQNTELSSGEEDVTFDNIKYTSISGISKQEKILSDGTRMLPLRVNFDYTDKDGKVTQKQGTIYANREEQRPVYQAINEFITSDLVSTRNAGDADYISQMMNGTLKTDAIFDKVFADTNKSGYLEMTEDVATAATRKNNPGLVKEIEKLEKEAKTLTANGDDAGAAIRTYQKEEIEKKLDMRSKSLQDFQNDVPEGAGLKVSTFQLPRSNARKILETSTVQYANTPMAILQPGPPEVRMIKTADGKGKFLGTNGNPMNQMFDNLVGYIDEHDKTGKYGRDFAKTLKEMTYYDITEAIRYNQTGEADQEMVDAMMGMWQLKLASEEYKRNDFTHEFENEAQGKQYLRNLEKTHNDIESMFFGVTSAEKLLEAGMLLKKYGKGNIVKKKYP